MTDEDVSKLISKLIKFLATREDIELLATKENLQMLATKEDLKSLATKEDTRKLASEIKKLNTKANTILEFAEAVDENVADHSKRLNRIEAVTIFTH